MTARLPRHARPVLIAAVALVCATMARGPIVAQSRPGDGQAASGQEEKREHPLVPAIRIARDTHRRMLAVGSYDADFTKKELVKRRFVTERIRIKVRHDPFSVYMYFKNPHAGREVIYVEGANDGHLLAHEAGIKSIVGTVRLLPTSADAMQDNRYPITRIGAAHMVKTIIDQWTLESRYAESEVKYYRDARIGETPCKVIECTHPKPRRQFKFHKTRLWISARTNLPIRVEQYGFPGADGKAPLVEQYTYEKLRPNIGLTDRDFNKNNPRYNF